MSHRQATTIWLYFRITYKTAHLICHKRIKSPPIHRLINTVGQEVCSISKNSPSTQAMQATLSLLEVNTQETPLSPKTETQSLENFRISLRYQWLWSAGQFHIVVLHHHRCPEHKTELWAISENPAQPRKLVSKGLVSTSSTRWTVDLWISSDILIRTSSTIHLPTANWVAIDHLEWWLTIVHRTSLSNTETDSSNYIWWCSSSGATSQETALSVPFCLKFLNSLLLSPHPQDWVHCPGPQHPTSWWHGSLLTRTSRQLQCSSQNRASGMERNIYYGGGPS